MTAALIVCSLLILRIAIEIVFRINHSRLEQKIQRLERIDRLNQLIYSPQEYEELYGDKQ